MSSSGPHPGELAVSAPDLDAMTAALTTFLAATGITGPEAEQSARRSSEAWNESLLGGYREDPAAILAATFDEVSGDLVTVGDIPFVSVCSHHLLPFFGRAHVAYRPTDRLVGLGRIEDLVRCLSRRLQLQEQLGQQIADSLADHLAADGAACILEAEHLCVFARGRRQRGTVARTTAYAGPGSSDPIFQQQCLAMLSAAPAERAAAPQEES